MIDLASSAANRDLPIPGSPSMITSCDGPPCEASHAVWSRRSSCWRPIIGARAVGGSHERGMVPPGSMPWAIREPNSSRASAGLSLSATIWVMP